LININASNIYQLTEIRLLIISKLLIISSNCVLRSSANQHSIVQLLIWNEIQSDANTAAHLSIGPNVNGRQNLTGFFECFLAVSGGSRMIC